MGEGNARAIYSLVIRLEKRLSHLVSTINGSVVEVELFSVPVLCTEPALPHDEFHLP